MKKKLLLFCVTASLLLTACGSSSASTTGYYTSDYSTESSYDYDGSSYDYDNDESYVSGTYSDSENLAETTTQTAEELSQKLIYSGSADIETTDFDTSVSDVKTAITEAGGFIESESLSNNNYYWYSSESSRDDRTLQITLRIPSDQFEDFFAGLDQFGKVMNQSTNVENITQRYYSNEANITAKQTELNRLLAMMDQAETIEDMIAVEERISEVEAELSQYQTAKNTMDLDTSYSTITLYIEEVSEVTPSSNVADSFSYRLKKAFVGGWTNLFEGIGDVFIGILYALPTLIILLIIIFVVIRVIKRAQRKKKAKRAETNVPNNLGNSPNDPNNNPQ